MLRLENRDDEYTIYSVLSILHVHLHTAEQYQHLQDPLNEPTSRALACPTARPFGRVVCRGDGVVMRGNHQ
jgi:hypothetical protein